MIYSNYIYKHDNSRLGNVVMAYVGGRGYLPTIFTQDYALDAGEIETLIGRGEIAPRMEERTRAALFAEGAREFGKAWKEERANLVKWVTGGKQTSARCLTERQGQYLVDYLKSRRMKQAA